MSAPQWIKAVTSMAARVAVVMAVYLAACRPQPEPPPPPTHTPVPTPRPTHTPVPTPTKESPLKRHDAPPEGVAAQVSLWLPWLSNFCVASPDGEPQPRVDAGYNSVEIATESPICFLGFAPNQDIEAQVTLPDGNVRRNQIPADDSGIGEWSWTSLPGDSIGVYEVTATQGTCVATDTFTVSEPTGLRILVLPQSGPPGTTFQIALAGFQPGQRVSLRLYREEDLQYRYTTTLTQVEMDERGQTIYALNTLPDDPEGNYLVVTEPSVAGLGMFCVATSAAEESIPLVSISPEEAVKAYWEAVSNGQYATAWAGLCASFKERKHSNSYTDYVQGYQGMKLCSVDTTDVRLVQQSDRDATVFAHLVYRTGSKCTISEHDFNFYLVRDLVRNTWLIDRVDSK